MRLTPEIFTSKLQESAAFYCAYLGFSVKQRDEGFLVLQQQDRHKDQLMLCEPHLRFNQPIFHPEYRGEGLTLQLETDDVREMRLKVPDELVVLELIEEPVNGLHFTVRDPNGVLVDIVQFG